MGNTKTKFLRRVFAAAAALSVVAVPIVGESSGAFAETKDYDKEIAALEQKAEQIKRENEQRKQEMGNLSDSVDENNAQMDIIQQQIDGINDEINTYSQMITTQQEKITAKELEISDVEKSIEKKQADIEQKEVEISDLESRNKENLERFAKLIRALKMADPTDTLPILEGSDDWYNFFTYVDVVQDISRQNLEFMNSLLDDIHHQQDLIVGLENDITQLNADKADLLDKKTDLESELSELEGKKSEVQQIVNERTGDLYDLSYKNETIKDKINRMRSEINASNEDVEAINSAIAELIREKQAQNSGSEVVYSSDGFRWPLDSNLQYITTYFGWDSWRGGNHYGIDVGNAGIGGKNIYAAQGGKVITAYGDGGYHGGFGNYVIIDHGGGLSTVYAHCSAVNVVVGQQVNKGDVIGYVGSTGWSTGNHLHFETRVNGTAVNPFSYSYEYV